jgi:hypothetical protein
MYNNIQKYGNTTAPFQLLLTEAWEKENQIRRYRSFSCFWKGFTWEASLSNGKRNPLFMRLI